MSFTPDAIRLEILSAMESVGVKSPMDLVNFFRLSDPGYAAELESLVNQLWPSEAERDIRRYR